MRRKIKIFLILFILLILYIYIANITLFPKSIVLMQGEKINLATLWGININEKENSNPNIGEYKTESLIEASSIAEDTKIEEIGKIDLNLNLFNSFNVKDVSVTVVPKTTVIPLGNAIGLKLYTEGVLIVGMTEIEGIKPYENTGIKEGDRIISINDIQISNAEDLVETVNKSNGKEIVIKYIRNETEEIATMTPMQTEENEYKLGLWVRDAAAGVGTATFYVPSSRNVCIFRTWYYRYRYRRINYNK